MAFVIVLQLYNPWWVILPADFHADHFDHTELQQLGKALPAVYMFVIRLLQQLRPICALINLGSHGPVVTMLLFDSRFCARYDVHHISHSTDLISVVGEFCYDVSWVRKGYQEPSEYLVVKQVVVAARQFFARSDKHKKPVSSVLVGKVISLLAGDLGDLQLAALFSLGFFGFP